MHHANKYSHNTAQSLRPVWLYGWVVLYKLNGYGFESRCSYWECFFFVTSVIVVPISSNLSWASHWKCFIEEDSSLVSHFVLKIEMQETGTKRFASSLSLRCAGCNQTRNKLSQEVVALFQWTQASFVKGIKNHLIILLADTIFKFCYSGN